MGIEELPFKKQKQKRRHVQTETRKAQQAKYLKRGSHGQKAVHAEIHFANEVFKPSPASLKG